MSHRTCFGFGLLAGLLVVSCADGGSSGELGDEHGDTNQDGSGPIVTEQDIAIVEEAIRSIQLDAAGQFNKDDVIKATIKTMSEGGHAPGPSERAFVDDLISALDKNDDKDTAMVIDGEELERLTSDYEELISFCFREVAYATVFNHLQAGELGAARLDESGLRAFDDWADIECDE
jgi:hypothetical protein